MSKIKSRGYSIHEKEIIRVLYKVRRPLSFRELSMLSNLSWATTKKYVKILEKKGIVKVYYLPQMKTPKTVFNFELVKDMFASTI